MEIIGTEIPDNQKNNKKLIIGILIVVSILFVISIALVITIAYMDSKQFKFTIDGVAVSNFPEDLFIFEDNEVYISIKDFAPLLDYTAFNGGYGSSAQFSEDTTQCYIQNSQEVASFEMDSSRIYKTRQNNQDDYEYFTIDEPVRYIENKLYVAYEGIGIACNARIEYNQEKNEIQVYSLPYLVKLYTKAYKNANIKNSFENQKALLYNMLIISEDTGNGKQFGVFSLTDGKDIVGPKYDEIKFVESTQEFIVKTSNKKVGIITAKGETKVAPQYDGLKQIDRDLNLYLATNNKKQGIIERNGKILIYLEYDEIGIDLKNFSDSEIKNKYLLYDNCIPVRQGNKWGIYDKTGNLIVPIEYDSLGCVVGTSKNKSARNVITIPEVEGIVLAKELQLENNKKQKFYTVVNSLGRELVPLAIETIYSVISGGREEYIMVNNGTDYDVIDYIRRNSSTGTIVDNDENPTNTITNTVTDSITNTTEDKKTEQANNTLNSITTNN